MLDLPLSRASLSSALQECHLEISILIVSASVLALLNRRTLWSESFFDVQPPHMIAGQQILVLILFFLRARGEGVGVVG